MLLFAQKGKVNAMFTISSLFFSDSVVQNPFCSWHAASRFPKKWGVKGLRVGVKLALIVTFLFGRQSPQQRVSRWPEGWADIWNNFIRQLKPRWSHNSHLSIDPSQLVETILRILFLWCSQREKSGIQLLICESSAAFHFKQSYLKTCFKLLRTIIQSHHHWSIITITPLSGLNFCIWLWQLRFCNFHTCQSINCKSVSQSNFFLGTFLQSILLWLWEKDVVNFGNLECLHHGGSYWKSSLFEPRQVCCLWWNGSRWQ